MFTEDIYPQFHLSSLDFDLNNLTLLHPYQLALVMFNPNATDLQKLTAEGLFLRYRERDRKFIGIGELELAGNKSKETSIHLKEVIVEGEGLIQTDSTIETIKFKADNTTSSSSTLLPISIPLTSTLSQSIKSPDTTLTSIVSPQINFLIQQSFPVSHLPAKVNSASTQLLSNSNIYPSNKQVDLDEINSISIEDEDHALKSLSTSYVTTTTNTSPTRATSSKILDNSATSPTTPTVDFKNTTTVNLQDTTHASNSTTAAKSIEMEVERRSVSPDVWSDLRATSTGTGRTEEERDETRSTTSTYTNRVNDPNSPSDSPTSPNIKTRPRNDSNSSYSSKGSGDFKSSGSSSSSNSISSEGRYSDNTIMRSSNKSNGERSNNEKERSSKRRRREEEEDSKTRSNRNKRNESEDHQSQSSNQSSSYNRSIDQRYVEEEYEQNAKSPYSSRDSRSISCSKTSSTANSNKIRRQNNDDSSFRALSDPFPRSPSLHPLPSPTSIRGKSSRAPLIPLQHPLLSSAIVSPLYKTRPPPPPLPRSIPELIEKSLFYVHIGGIAPNTTLALLQHFIMRPSSKIVNTLPKPTALVWGGNHSDFKIGSTNSTTTEKYAYVAYQSQSEVLKVVKSLNLISMPGVSNSKLVRTLITNIVEECEDLNFENLGEDIKSIWEEKGILLLSKDRVKDAGNEVATELDPSTIVIKGMSNNYMKELKRLNLSSSIGSSIINSKEKKNNNKVSKKVIVELKVPKIEAVEEVEIVINEEEKDDMDMDMDLSDSE